MKIKSFLFSTISVVLILFLTGCLKKKEKDQELVISNGNAVAKISDFKEIISILEKSETGLQFIPMLPEEEQEKIYSKLVEEYIISNFLIKKYLEENKINSSDSYKEEYKQYIKVMENNFNAAAFQKSLNESIVITDEFAENYYLNNRESTAEFIVAPFVKKVPGIEARAVRIEDGKVLNDYKERLKNNKDVIYLDKINASVRGTSKILVDTLKSMNNNEIREIKIENGMSFAVMKLTEHKGEWVEYKEVSQKVNSVLRGKMLQSKYEETLKNLKDKYKVEINTNCIKEYVKKSGKKEEPSEAELEKAVNEISETIAEEKADEMKKEMAEELKDGIKEEIVNSVAEEA